MSTLQSVPALGTHPASGSHASRAETREQLSKATYDLLVIGGGILGISTAWHAAQAGLRVALVDAGDFSRRHLLRLLQAAPRRPALPPDRRGQAGRGEPLRAACGVPSGRTAPRQPLTFYLPVYKGGPHGAAKLGAGVFAYSALSAFGDGVGHVISPAKAQRDVPELRTDNLKAVAVYGDDQMNDSRMALMTVRAAVEALRHGPQPRRGHRTALHPGPGHRCGAQGPYGRPGVRRQRPPGPQRHRPVGGPPAQDGGRERGPLHPAVEGCAPGPQADRALEGRAGHPDRQVPHHLRPPLGGHAAAGHHGRGVRGRPGGCRGHREGHRPDPGRGGLLRPRPAAVARSDHVLLRGSAGAARRPRRHLQGQARDGRDRGQRRHAVGGRMASGRPSGTSAVRS